jgi:hypothetical protein
MTTLDKAVSSTTPIQRDWLLKTLAGVVGGYLLALGLSGLFAWWGPGGIEAASKVQFNMWLIAPIWLAVMSLVYLIRSGWLALVWLLALDLIVYGLLYLARTIA